VLSKYSSSADRLEQMLASMKDNTNNTQNLDKLRLEHNMDIDRLRVEHDKEVHRLKLSHMSETNKLLERIKNLERSKHNVPEVCEIDLSSAFATNDEKDTYGRPHNYSDSMDKSLNHEYVDTLALSQSNMRSPERSSQASYLNLKENVKLTRDLKELASENDRLFKKYSKAKSQIDSSKSENRKLAHDNKVLQNKIQHLAKERDDVKVRLVELKKAYSSGNSQKVQNFGSKQTSKVAKNRIGSGNTRIKQGGCKKKVLDVNVVS
jgi:hypothetical protein